MTTFMMYNRGDMAHFLEEDVVAELPWDPEARYEALVVAAALDQENDVLHSASFAMATETMRAVASARHSRAVWALDAPAEPKLASALAYNAADAVARDLSRGSDATPAEYSYDPVMRYNALAHTFKQPKGGKTVDHLEVLRQVSASAAPTSFSGLSPINATPHT